MIKKTNFRVFVLSIILGSILFLTGCVRYDVGINFTTPHQGTIVQHIKIGEQLTSLNRTEAKKWLNSIEKRSRQLQGNVNKLNSEELIVTIPFGNGKELVDKFDRLFHSESSNSSLAPETNADLVKLDSQMSLQQKNFIFLERNNLDLTIDLRALSALSDSGRIVINSGSLIDLQFKLNTPWLARSVGNNNTLAPIANDDLNGLVWQLEPGQINHIEAIFWLPSPLGIGAMAIAVLMISGFFLKYKHLPGIA
jgi:hypothetical protein